MDVLITAILIPFIFLIIGVNLGLILYSRVE